MFAVQPVMLGTNLAIVGAYRALVVRGDHYHALHVSVLAGPAHKAPDVALRVARYALAAREPDQYRWVG